MSTTRGPLLRGERAPDFVLPRADGERTRFYGFVGGSPSLLLFTGDGRAGDPSPLLAALEDASGDRATVHVVAGDGVAATGALRDDEGGLHEAYGVDADGPCVFVLDANVRVVEVIRDADPRLAAATARRALTDLGTDRVPTRATRHAPVLLIPDALEPELCDQLIERCATHGTFETGVEAGGTDGRVEQTDRRRKRRRDHTVDDPELLRRLTSRIGRRIMPELAKAFAYRATRFEGFKIGCYAADTQGFFEAHRDNLSPSTAHRRFALTLNLNDGYEGGELCFPEYGPQLYRPEAGEALVFSGSHLHEVRPVTAGERYVLVSFLYGEEATRRQR